MATVDEYLALSEAVYKGPGDTTPIDGWEKIAESPVVPGNQGSNPLIFMPSSSVSELPVNQNYQYISIDYFMPLNRTGLKGG